MLKFLSVENGGPLLLWLPHAPQGPKPLGNILPLRARPLSASGSLCQLHLRRSRPSPPLWSLPDPQLAPVGTRRPPPHKPMDTHSGHGPGCCMCSSAPAVTWVRGQIWPQVYSRGQCWGPFIPAPPAPNPQARPDRHSPSAHSRPQPPVCCPLSSWGVDTWGNRQCQPPQPRVCKEPSSPSSWASQGTGLPELLLLEGTGSLWLGRSQCPSRGQLPAAMKSLKELQAL